MTHAELLLSHRGQPVDAQRGRADCHGEVVVMESLGDMDFERDVDGSLCEVPVWVDVWRCRECGARIVWDATSDAPRNVYWPESPYKGPIP
jgi:hypothetical protein